jgi:hypothetical protein
VGCFWSNIYLLNTSNQTSNTHISHIFSAILIIIEAIMTKVLSLYNLVHLQFRLDQFSHLNTTKGVVQLEPTIAPNPAP